MEFWVARGLNSAGKGAPGGRQDLMVQSGGRLSSSGTSQGGKLLTDRMRPISVSLCVAVTYFLTALS